MLLAAALALSLPLHFEPNRGQASDPTRFVAAAPSYTLFLSDTAIAMQFPHGGALSMTIPATRVEPLDPLPGHSNYYAGADRSAWRTGVAQYARIQYRAVFPGVDLAVYGKSQQVEYDWVVAPGADPSIIHFSFSGASRMHVDRDGDLVLDTAAGEVRHRKPEIYQTVVGRTRRIDGRFVVARGEVRFRVGAYDKRLALTIDPRLVYSVASVAAESGWTCRRHISSWTIPALASPSISAETLHHRHHVLRRLSPGPFHRFQSRQ